MLPLFLSLTYSLTFLDMKSAHLSLMQTILCLTPHITLDSLLLISFLFISYHTCVFVVVYSLLDFLGSEIQVSVADPLNLEPVLEVVVSTAAKLHLQTINGLLLEATARDVRILVEPDAVPQAHLKQRIPFAKCFRELHNAAVLVPVTRTLSILDVLVVFLKLR